jgi:hypothetical protein
MKLRASSYFLIFLLLLMVGVIGVALGWRFRTAKLVPLVMGGFIFVMAAIQLARDIMAARRLSQTEASASPDKAGTASGAMTDKGEWRRFTLTLSWVVGFIVAIYIVGFLISIPIFVVSFVKSRGRGWLFSIATALLTVLVIYGIFEYALKLPIYRGLIFS